MLMRSLCISALLLLVNACGSSSDSSLLEIDQKAYPIVFQVLSVGASGFSGEWEVEAQFKLWWGKNLNERRKSHYTQSHGSHRMGTHYTTQEYRWVLTLPSKRSAKYEWPERKEYQSMQHDEREFVGKYIEIPSDQCFENCVINYAVYDVDSKYDDVLVKHSLVLDGPSLPVLTDKQNSMRDLQGESSSVWYRAYRRNKGK